MATRVRINQREVQRYIDTEGRRYLAEVSAAVLRVARFGTPYRTGALAGSGRVRGPVTRGLRIASQVVFTARHAKWVHQGTGIYGPRRRMIRPISKQVLRWVDGAGVHFAKQVRGMRGRPYLMDALRQVCEPLGFTVRELNDND